MIFLSPNVQENIQKILSIFSDDVYFFLDRLIIIRNDILYAMINHTCCNNCATLLITRAIVPPPIERRSNLSWEIRARVGRPRGNGGRCKIVGFSRGARTLFVVTVCHTAGVRFPCVGVRRIDNLFTISSARTHEHARTLAHGRHVRGVPKPFERRKPRRSIRFFKKSNDLFNSEIRMYSSSSIRWAARYNNSLMSSRLWKVLLWLSAENEIYVGWGTTGIWIQGPSVTNQSRWHRATRHTVMSIYKYIIYFSFICNF